MLRLLNPRLNPKYFIQKKEENLYFKTDAPSDSDYGGLFTPPGEIPVQSLEKRIRLEIRDLGVYVQVAMKTMSMDATAQGECVEGRKQTQN